MPAEKKYILLRDDDDGGVHVHLKIYCFVDLKSILQTNPGLFPKVFKRLASSTLI
jgi:hypothetical protein